MRPATRACYGASVVGIFTGLLMAIAGTIILLETAYLDGQVGHTIWTLVCFVIAAGFSVMFLALLGCGCALCIHASGDSSVHPDEEDMDKKPNGWTSPTNGWVEEANVWTMPESPDKESEEIVAAAEEEEEDLVAELEAELKVDELEAELEEAAPEEEEEEEGEKEKEKEEEKEEEEQKEQEEGKMEES